MLLSISLSNTSSWAATISGTITNSSGKTGWITIGLQTQSNNNSSLGTAVKLSNGASTSYSIVGVPDNSYTLDAYLDTTNSGMRHANDPAVATPPIVVISGDQDLSSQNLTIGSPGSIPLTVAPSLGMVPGNQGMFVQVMTDNQKDGNGRPIADSYSLACSPGNITVSVPSGDNSFALLSGLTNGSTLSCSATPVVNGVADNTHVGSGSSPVGDCNFTSSCAGTARLSGKVTFANGVDYATKTLFVAAVPPTGGQPFVAAISNLQTNPVTVDIYGVPVGTYKIYTILDVDGSKTIGAGDLQIQDTTAPVVIANGLDTLITLPTVTLTAVNSYLEFGVHHGKNSTQNDKDYNYTLYLTDGLKHPVKLTIKDTNTPQATTLFTAGRDNYGSGFWLFGPNVPRPVLGATVGYADITYDNDSVDSNIPLTVKAILDEFPPVTFPSGSVRLPSNSTPQASWRFPGPLPGYYYSYRTWMSNCNTNGDNPNDFLLNNTLLTTFGGCPQLQNGSPSNWSLQLKDQFGNSTEQYSSFTPQAGGPVISSFTPSSGVISQAISLTGSGFTGATAVSINGFGMPFTPVDDSHITINQGATAIGFNSGPILVTSGGITGTSASSYIGLAQVTGSVKNSAGTTVAATIKLINSNPLVSVDYNGSGTYTLPGIPAGIPYQLKISSADSSILPTYTKTMIQTSNGTGFDWNLYSAVEVAGWGVTPGKGVIRARVSSQDPPSGTTNSNVTGATVKASSWLHPDAPYTVKYDDGTGIPGTGTSTPANGVFYVMNIDEGDNVTVIPQATSFSFQPLLYQVHADAVSVGRVVGAAVPTGITTTTTATPVNGSYTGTINIGFTLSPSSTYYGNIVYTTDGRDPRIYSGTSVAQGNTIPISSTTTIRYVFRSSLNNTFGPMGSTTFVIQKPPSNIALRSNSGGAGETLTLDGSFPDTNNANYQVLFNGVTPATNLSVNFGSNLTFTVPAGNFTNFTLNYFGQVVYTGNLLSVAINGNGTVNDNGVQPTGFYCASASCQRYFDTTASLNLTPTPSNGSVFQSWTPTCAGGSGPNGCAVSMSTPVNKAAAFVFATPKTFKIYNTNVADDVLQNVYEQVFTNNYPPGTVLQGLAGTGPYSQDFSANRNVDVIIKGGFDNGFSGNAGTFTTIHPLNPPLTIQNGKVVFVGIKVN
jgi:hypothetical protein